MVMGMMVYIYIYKTESDEVFVHDIRRMDMWVINGGEMRDGSIRS